MIIHITKYILSFQFLVASQFTKLVVKSYTPELLVVFGMKAQQSRPSFKMSFATSSMQLQRKSFLALASISILFQEKRPKKEKQKKEGNNSSAGIGTSFPPKPASPKR